MPLIVRLLYFGFLILVVPGNPLQKYIISKILYVKSCLTPYSANSTLQVKFWFSLSWNHLSILKIKIAPSKAIHSPHWDSFRPVGPNQRWVIGLYVLALIKGAKLDPNKKNYILLTETALLRAKTDLSDYIDTVSS